MVIYDIERNPAHNIVYKTLGLGGCAMFLPRISVCVGGQ